MASGQSTPTSGRGSGVGIAAWFLLVVSTVALITRLATKWAIGRVLHSDDLLAVIALTFSIGTTVAVHFLAQNGLGTTMATLDSDHVSGFMKSLYALSLLYIPTLCFAKLSIIALIRDLTPTTSHRSAGLALGALIAVASFAMEIAAAFQCRPPHTWISAGNKCFQRASFWRTVGSFNILFDLGLIALPFYIIVPLQMRVKWKVLVLSSFGVRFLDIGATAAQLNFISGFESTDLSGSFWQWALLAQIAQCVSIVTSCVPYLRPLFENLPSGLMLSDDLQRRSNNTSQNYYTGTRTRTKTRPSTKGSVAVDFPPTPRRGAGGAGTGGAMELETARHRLEVYEDDSGGITKATSEENTTRDSTSLHSQRRMLAQAL